MVLVAVFCGIGGIRTRVQTPIEKDFYMLSLLLFVGNRQGTNQPT